MPKLRNHFKTTYYPNFKIYLFTPFAKPNKYMYVVCSRLMQHSCFIGLTSCPFFSLVTIFELPFWPHLISSFDF